MAQFNHSEAEKIVSMTDQQRLNSRATALIGDDKPEKKKSPPAPLRRTKTNVVLQQMKAKQFTQAYGPVFQKLRDAVAAAERACQNPAEGVQSKKEADALLDRTLKDLSTVVETIRTERKDLIKQRSPEELAHPHLIA